MLEELSKRNDLTVVVRFRYLGKRWRVVVPAGYAVQTLLNQEGYSGFFIPERSFRCSAGRSIIDGKSRPGRKLPPSCGGLWRSSSIRRPQRDGTEEQRKIEISKKELLLESCQESKCGFQQELFFNTIECSQSVHSIVFGMRCKRVSLHFHHRQGHCRLRCRRKTVQLRQTVSGQRFVRHLTD